MQEFEAQHDKPDILTHQFSRRTGLKKAGALLSLGVAANVLNYDNLANITLPFGRELLHIPWDYSLHRAERDFCEITDEERQELLGDGEFESLPLLESENRFSGNGTYDIRFELDSDQLVSLDVALSGAEPDSANLAPVVLAQFQNLIYQVPVLITPSAAEQHIPLRFAQQGENFVRVARTTASEEVNSENISLGISRPKKPTPVYAAILNSLAIVGMRQDNFFNYLKEDASPVEQRRALTKQAAFFYEIELKAHKNDPDLLVAEVWRGGRDELPRDPKNLYNETGRLYDYDPIQLIFLDRQGNIYRIDYQTDNRRTHEIESAHAFSIPQPSASLEVAQECFFHEIQNSGEKGKNTGHGMVGKGLETVVVDGADQEITIVSSFIPPVRKWLSIEDITSRSDIEVELSRRRLGIHANFENLVESIGAEDTDNKEKITLDINNPVKIFLDSVSQTVDQQLALLAGR